jgi:hypothetical protein
VALSEAARPSSQIRTNRALERVKNFVQRAEGVFFSDDYLDISTEQEATLTNSVPIVKVFFALPYPVSFRGLRTTIHNMSTGGVEIKSLDDQPNRKPSIDPPFSFG